MKRALPSVASTAIFAVAFVVLGLPDFAHGVAWGDMRHDLHRPLADLGVFLTVSAIGYILVATQTGRIAKRWSMELLVLASTLLSAIGLVLIAAAPVWLVALIGSFALGVGSGGMDAGLNAAVALRGDGRLMGLLHAGYGLGAAMGPLVLGATLAGVGGWRAAYALFAAVSFLLVVPLLGKSLGEAPPQEHMGSPRGVVLVCLTFMLYVALEATVGQWAFTSLSRQRHLSDLAAAAWVAIYWLALTAGRVWLGVRGHRVEPRRVLVIAAGGAVLGTGVLWLGGPVSPAGLAMTGLALSVVFPLMMLLTPERIGADRAAAAVGWQTAAASVGAAIGPLVVGIILGRSGVGAYGPSVAVMAILLLAAVRFLSGPRRPDHVAAT